MARYPGHPVAVGKTQFMLRTVGFAAADSQVTTFQLVSTLLLIMEGETETQTYFTMRMYFLPAVYYHSSKSEGSDTTNNSKVLQICHQRNQSLKGY